MELSKRDVERLVTLILGGSVENKEKEGVVISGLPTVLESTIKMK